MCEPPDSHIPHTRPCPETFSGLPRLERLQLCQEVGLGSPSNTKWEPSPPSPHQDRFCLPENFSKSSCIRQDGILVLVLVLIGSIHFPDFGEWTMKETASAVGATISGAYSAFLGGMAIKLAIEGIRRSFVTSNVPSSDLEASNSGYDADQSSSASETGATPKRVNNPKPRNRRRCPCPCNCPDRSKKDDKTHRRDEPKNYKPAKTTQL